MVKSGRSFSIPATEAGRAKFESHYDSTAPLLRLRLTLAPLFELDYVAVQ
jgi:hypothetical protein